MPIVVFIIVILFIAYKIGGMILNPAQALEGIFNAAMGIVKIAIGLFVLAYIVIAVFGR